MTLLIWVGRTIVVNLRVISVGIRAHVPFGHVAL
ncbi:hypothetical protein C5167_011968 [Papaver somniferum]|uniref:Uncharacterized protein n=1 Tax=Papaver somniferum TaxID=3469 RepID=A0A4Y7J024_PAPSO|nr:hypothetical protein C5167_011968 [Papaver somniferum]